MILIFDTETTGKAFLKLPLDHASQPRIIQLGAILMDKEWQVRAEVNLIAKGIDIPQEASAIHGITNEVANECGVPQGMLLDAFHELSKLAKVVVAHNFDFDRFMVAREMAIQTQCYGSFGHLKDMSFCTMKAMTPICQIPGSYDDFKWPKLIEAYRHCFNEDFDGAHDAMADVRACARVYRWLMERAKPNV